MRQRKLTAVSIPASVPYRFECMTIASRIIDVPPPRWSARMWGKTLHSELARCRPSTPRRKVLYHPTIVPPRDALIILPQPNWPGAMTLSSNHQYMARKGTNPISPLKTYTSQFFWRVPLYRPVAIAARFLPRRPAKRRKTVPR